MPSSPDSEPTPIGELLAGSVGFLLSKLGIQTAARFASVLEPLGIRPQHFALLRYLGNAEGRSQQALAEMLGIPPSRMVALVDDLQERGFVERRPNPADRRAHAVYLTGEGKRMLEQGLAVAVEHERRLCAGLSAEERDTLVSLLRKLAADPHLPIGVHPGLAGTSPVAPTE